MSARLSRRRCHNYTLRRAFQLPCLGHSLEPGLGPLSPVQPNRQPAWLLGRDSLVGTLVPSLGVISLPWHTRRWVVVGGLKTIKNFFHLSFDSFIDVNHVLIPCTPSSTLLSPENLNTFPLPPFFRFCNPESSKSPVGMLTDPAGLIFPR